VSGRPSAPNPAGAHFLRDRTLITRLVRACGAGEGQLVLDLGAGAGAITAGLAETGARVIAVERDPHLATTLRRRFASDPRVRVVEADLRHVPLPHREFLVVASPPFSLTTMLCRRLLGDPNVKLAGAELIIGWGAARWLASPRPRDAETAWWAARYHVRLAQTISADSFRPAPSVDAARLSIRPRCLPPSLPRNAPADPQLPPQNAPADPQLPPQNARADRQLRALLRAAYRRPQATLADAGLRDHRRLLIKAGLDPRAPVATVTAEQWHRLAVLLAPPARPYRY
jgi:23S rRNA (adenine-N6)-dimethyltransferase